MKKYSKVILAIILVIIAILYSYYVRPVVDDELFNYGFGKNILDGLVPYKDFNMIIPPLFSYITALFLAILGKKLIVYHLMMALIIVIITLSCYQKIGKKALIIYLLLLIYPYTGYNMFSLLLLFILVNKKDSKHSELIEALIISCMFLTKQTLGLLVIPSLIFSKNKLKVFSIYLGSILLFILYLLLNNNFLEFLDYCVLGMFDFTNKNNTGVANFFYFEIIIIVVLAVLAIKKKDKNLSYLLMFQIITFPIVDYVHFIISFVPVVYFILKKTNNYFTFYLTATFVTFFLFLNFGIFIQNDNYLYLSHYKVDNFMKGRVTYNFTSEYIQDIKKLVNEKEEYTPYILGHFAYLIKLNNNFRINKFDIINNGNMGYNGAEKYIKELESTCKIKKCLFILNDTEITTKKNIQTNREILKYVTNNYQKKFSSSIYSVYYN